MKASKYRWGIVSTGHIASVLTDDLQLLADHAEVVAVASRELSRAEAFAGPRGIPRAYGSYAELAADPEVDVVYVATPHHDHLPTTRLMLEAGKAVLCEKPLATSAADAEALIELARERGVFLMEAMWTRTNPLVRKAAELVAAGELGELRHFSAQFGFRFTGSDDHRLVNPELAGGAIWDLGVYPAHLANLFLGAPDDLVATGSLGPTGVDANATALLAFDATETRPAATATLHCSLESALQPRLQLLGSEGRIEIDSFVKPTEMRIVRGEETETVHTELPGHGYTFQIMEVQHCLTAGAVASELVSWSSTLEVAEVLDEWLAGVREAADAARGDGDRSR